MATAHLSWTLAAGINQDVMYKRDEDDSFTLYDTVSGSTNSIDIPGLDDNTVYQFVIINKCLFDMEGPSDAVNGGLITCPALSVDQTALSLTVHFTHLGGDITQYLVKIYEGDGSSEIFFIGEEVLLSSDGLTVTFNSLSSNTYYTIKVIPQADGLENDDCSIMERTLGCAEDYTLAPDGSYCYKVEETAPTAPTDIFLTTAVAFDSYSTLGSFIFEPGFFSNGTGTANRITLSNPFWVNGPGDGGSHTYTDGPLNRCGLWSEALFDDQTVGFAVCVNLTESKTYYIGVGSDNKCSITIDGVVLVDQNPTSLGFEFGYGISTTFKAWLIYPVTLSSGPHIIEMIGYNQDSQAALGAEIYNNTSAELIAATSYDDLNMIFSTKDYRGEPMQLGSGDFGYTCPSGYSLASCEEPYVCRRILTALPS